MNETEHIWLVVIEREDRSINRGIRFSQAFANKPAAKSYAETIQEKEGIEGVHIVMRGVTDENYL